MTLYLLNWRCKAEWQPDAKWRAFCSCYSDREPRFQMRGFCFISSRLAAPRPPLHFTSRSLYSGSNRLNTYLNVTAAFMSYEGWRLFSFFCEPSVLCCCCWFESTNREINQILKCSAYFCVLQKKLDCGTSVITELLHPSYVWQTFNAIACTFCLVILDVYLQTV